MALDLEVGRHRRNQPFGQRLGGRRLRTGRRDDGEFVAADAGKECALACLFEAFRQLPQQRIAGRMTENIVDALEAVEVDAEHRKALAGGPGEIEHGVHALVECRAVGQVGQRIVMRHMRNLGFVALSLGDVMNRPR